LTGKSPAGRKVARSSIDDRPALDQLLAQRGVFHHVTGGGRFGALAEVEAFVGERQLVFLTGRGALPSLPEAIAGRRFSGSWWSQPEAHQIYALLETAEADGLLGAPMLTASLVSARHTVIAPSLATSVARLAADPERAERALANCSTLARQLIAAVSSDGSMRMDHPRFTGPAGRKARLELERGLLAFTTSFHTELGRHVAVLQPWAVSPIARSAPAGQLASLEDALAAIVRACLRSAVVAEAREAASWLRVGVEPDRLRSAWESLDLRRLRVAGSEWLALQQS